MNQKFIINNKEYDISDLSIVKNYKPEMLKLEPYPYIVIKNCLDQEIYDYLEKNYPSDKTIAGNMEKENTRYQLSVGKITDNNNIDEIWKLFTEYHTSERFYREIEKIFSQSTLVSLFNSRRNKKYKYQDLTIGKRIPPKNNYHKKIVLDCQIGINSPSTTISQVIRPHVDSKRELYAGLFYLKHDDDKGSGGDLNILDLKEKYDTIDKFNKIVGIRESRFFDDFENRLDVIDTVKYDKNTFVIFVNTNNSIHEVTPREPNPISRRLVNIIAEQYI